jgi:hypothetical protein
MATISGSRDSSGMSQNDVASVPRMLPAVEIEDRAPAERPICARPFVAARRTPSGVTIASSRAGAKKMSAEAAREPRRGPRSADIGSAALAMMGASTVSSPAPPMIGASVLEAPKRSATCPPSQ